MKYIANQTLLPGMTSTTTPGGIAVKELTTEARRAPRVAILKIVRREGKWEVVGFADGTGIGPFETKAEAAEQLARTRRMLREAAKGPRSFWRFMTTDPPPKGEAWKEYCAWFRVVYGS